MSTQQRSRTPIASGVHTEWPHVVSTVRTLAIVIPPIGFFLVARTPLLLPSMSLVALLSAAVVALAAWCMPSDRHSAGTTLWDISGAYAFIGFAAGMLSDPLQVLAF